MTQPGAIGSGMPADESSTLRRLADLERQMRELGPSIAGSFNSTVAQLESALANQVRPVAAHAESIWFAVPASYAELARCTVTVPAGYTRATVVAVSGMSARNTLAASDFDVRVSMLSYVDINGATSGAETRTSVYGGGIGMVTAGASTVLTGLGSTMYVRVFGRAMSAFAADPLNAVNLDVSVMFLR